MATDIDICNTALLKLGQGTGNLIVTSLSENSRNAKLCNALYAKKRDELLRSHVWNFAVARAELSQNQTAPVFGFAHAYDLPADWLRTLAVYETAHEAEVIAFRIEGTQLVSDTPTVFLKYIKQVTDPNVMTPDFREALATLLAWDLALPIADSNTLSEQMQRRHLRALRLAKASDALEDQAERFPVGSWVGER